MVRNQLFEQISYPQLEFKKNLTLNWLLPACNLSVSDINNLKLFDKSLNAFNTLIAMGFKGLYWGCPQLDENYKNCLILVFNPSKEVLFSEKWQIFGTFLKKLPNFRGLIDIDIGVIVLILSLDLKGQEVLRYLKKGKYSEISEKIAREYYIKVRNGGSYETDELLIVKKNKEYREYLENILDLPSGSLIDKELGSLPDEKDEVFNYKPKN